MPAPALSVPVRANLDAFKRQMEETSSLAKTAARKAAQHFLDINKELAGGAASAAFSGAASNALKLAGKIALVVGAAKLMGDAIGAARDQIREMVEIADKAQNLGVSPAFLQQFTAESRKLQVGVEDLEGALTHAFNATKDKPPIDLAAWDTGKDRITEVERALRIYNETLARTKGQTLEGLVLFRDADTQEKKVQAVLKAMVQLEGIGQRSAALDLGEKMFGAQFVDRIRQGRTSAESILSTMQQMASSDEAIYSNALVARAKAVDDQLKLSEDRLSRALKPSFDDLSSTILTIKNLWAEIVGYISTAVELANKLGILGNEVSRLKQQRDELDDSIKNGNEISIFGFKTGIRLPKDVITEDMNRAKRDEVQARIEDLTRDPNVYPRRQELEQSRGTGDRPTLKPTASGTERFDTAADAIEKRTAALQAEAAAIDLGTEARDKARITAQLETVAKQANAAAGKGENVVTEEQRKTINEVADAYGKAAVEMEKAKVAAQIKFDKQTAFLSQEDVAIAQQLKGIYPDVATALNSVEAAGMRAANGMRALSNLGQEVNRSMFVEFGQNLRNGMSAWDAFKNAGVNALGRIADKLMEMAANRLWESVFSGGGGGLAGGLLGGIGKLFGFSSGGYASGGTGLSLTSTGGLYASGGYTGGGGKYEPAGVVHRGEYVFSAPAVNRIGVANLERMHRGYADGGLVDAPLPMRQSAPASGSASSDTGGVHVTVGVSVDENGNLQAYVKNIAQQSAAKQIGTYTQSHEFKLLAGVASREAVKQGWVR